MSGLYEALLAGAAGELPAASRPPRASAAVVPWRRQAGELEVFWVQRSPKLRFMGGWHAFPGGAIGRDDADIALEGTPRGTDDAQVSNLAPGLDGAGRRRFGPDLPAGLVAGALRELFEETGLLVTCGALGDADPAVRRGVRGRLLAGEVSFATLLEQHDWLLDASQLVFAGRWLTPPLAPLRFDNRFFLLEWPASNAAQPEIVDGELVEGEWLAPAAALARWSDGQALAAPPILHLLRVLAEDGPDAGLPRLRDPAETCFGPLREVELAPGIRVMPLRTPTLPPATHTNCFLLGHRKAVLVDPATPDADEQGRLLAALAEIGRRRIEIEAIWLTHHHADHVGAVEAVHAALGVPVLAHALAAEPLAQTGIAVDGELRDGQRIVLGAGSQDRSDDALAFPLRVLHTPGHTRGHLAFLAERGGEVVAGDLMSSLSTVVIDPPEGEMDAYLASLARVAALEPRILLPAHGPLVTAPARALKNLRRHRLQREQQVLRAWRFGQRTPAEIVAGLYPPSDEPLYPVAERQVLAHLIRLARLGTIEAPDEEIVW